MGKSSYCYYSRAPGAPGSDRDPGIKQGTIQMSIERKKVTRAIRRMLEEEPGPCAVGRGTVRARLSEEVSLR